MSERPKPQIAVWLFLAATFSCVSTLIFPDAPVWLRVATIAVGIVLLVAGGIRLRLELDRKS